MPRFVISAAVNFNPRSHKGSDANTYQLGSPIEFQSTLPQGERPRGQIPPTRGQNFNPRSHKGSDLSQMRSLSSPQISIHAPTRGATIEQYHAACYFAFQSTLPQGERLFYLPWTNQLLIFQSTLPQGERHMFFFSETAYKEFQSTLPQGERLRT